MIGEEAGDGSDNLVLKLCGGRDFLSKPVELSSDGKYIFCAEELKEGLPQNDLKTLKI